MYVCDPLIPKAPPISKSGSAHQGRTGNARNAPVGSSAPAEKSSFVNTNPAKKFDPTKVKTD